MDSLARLKQTLKIDTKEPAWVAEERAKLGDALEAIERQYPQLAGRLTRQKEQKTA